ncbi:MAG: NAD(P)/FAD-dependent oxidoreductase [Verrucomicrobia bacterium]|nr:NAD(P)/FAD-dependent oxidoreductase [Verrucomicrobiota bacterium]
MYDVVVVGAGHNGLICACYLAKLGSSVCIVERRSVVGGAVCTEEIVPGYSFDVGSSVHIMFKSTPIMEELSLASAGLEYIEMDPWAFYPASGGGGISFYRSVEKTCESIAQFSRKDADAYRIFVEAWGELNEGIWEAFLQTPTPGNLISTVLKRNLFHRKSRNLWKSTNLIRALLGSYGSLIEETFESEELRTAMTWFAAQSGPPPTEIATGDFAGWQAMIHRHGAWRAKGGSGSLTKALGRRLESLGGKIFLGEAVEKISKDGNRWHIRTAESVIEGRRVVGACHVKTLFGDLLSPELVSQALQKRVNSIRIGNGFGMAVRHAVSELPAYKNVSQNSVGAQEIAVPGSNTGSSEVHFGMQLLCPSRPFLQSAYYEYLQGRPPSDPAVLAMTFSALDPTLAPTGKHVLFAWAQYHPYQLSNGENWESIGEREADKIYARICDYAPNMEGALIGRFIQTPVEIERRIGLLKANVMHVEMSFDQMFTFRPLPELSTYRTPIEGLYLTGASTHPGGGVFGASGRNAAREIARDLGKKMNFSSLR